jgi:basic membrane lipoprotein Med (substrate-binding protein (PBP1-ABC) superfamily)
MQDASMTTRAKVEYLSVIGTPTAENALPYLNSLVQRGCDVIIAVGAPQVAAVSADARRFPSVRFVVVSVPVSLPNVVVVNGSGADEVRAQVRDAVVAAVRQSPSRR